MNEEKVRIIFRNVNFLKLLKAKLIKIASGKAIVSLNYDDKLTQIAGFLHGGVLATIADAAGAFALYTLIEDTSDLLTISLNITYLEPIKKGKIFARAKVIRKGKKISTVLIRIEDKDKTLYAYSIALYRISYRI